MYSSQSVRLQCGNNNPGTDGFTSHPLTNGLLYPIRIEAGSFLATAAAGSRVGPDLTCRWGVSGSMWGESGFESLSADSLWPYPNESRIKQDFTAYDNGSDEQRGFCAAATSLTTYVWQYLGNTIPPDVYGPNPDAEPPAAPRGLNVKALLGPP